MYPIDTALFAEFTVCMKQPIEPSLLPRSQIVMDHVIFLVHKHDISVELCEVEQGRIGLVGIAPDEHGMVRGKKIHDLGIGIWICGSSHPLIVLAHLAL